ncbi:MAG TPA: endonuclease/exonuclease/phosphatase family protein [Longimicrobium sp.]
MRILTWNCCRGPFAAKTDLLRALAPDIAVVQECARPAEESHRLRWVGDNPRQGVAVMGGDGWSVEPIAVAAETKKWIVPFRVSGPVDFTLVAVWALPDRSSYSRMVCHGIDALSDLVSSGPTVVTGDFNANPVFDGKRRDWTYATIEARLHAHELASAYHEFHREAPGEESRATYYHMWRRDLAYHLDYCFVPRAWLPRIADVGVGSYEAWEGRSDHRPVIIDLGGSGMDRVGAESEEDPTVSAPAPRPGRRNT